ncbi:MAG: MBL fold metallo-hydrolase [Phycisphaerae bacterium]|nr:MBL fold metallo-hydrolase [Phycisphaerae bacterium]
MTVTDDHVQPADHARLCVLASGSSGNCSVLVSQHSGRRSVCLIDLGLSPRRTSAALAKLGLWLSDVTDVLLTHLDIDHCQPAWAAALPADAHVHIFRGHVPEAERTGMLARPLRVFTSDFELSCGAEVSPLRMPHDLEGVIAFRLNWPRSSLGFATDLGRVTDGLVGHLAGVDVLAIESNYDPMMQRRAARPEFLKRRIMGGSGHLSNAQAAEAAQRIAPRDHVVLLHLSRQCNDPELVSRMHEGADYAFTISSHDLPTRWVNIGRPDAPRAVPDRARPVRNGRSASLRLPTDGQTEFASQPLARIAFQAGLFPLLDGAEAPLQCRPQAPGIDQA